MECRCFFLVDESSGHGDNGRKLPDKLSCEAQGRSPGLYIYLRKPIAVQISQVE